MEPLRKAELKEILIKGWMTHDAMWFLHCLRKTGIETTNKINRAASAGLGRIEAKRFKKILDINEIQTTDDLKRFIQMIFHVVKADFMKFTYKFLDDNKLQCEMHECFAHDGMKRIGVLDLYQCGIFERVEGWFKGLGLKFEVTPQINGCLMFQKKKCIRNYTFSRWQTSDKKE